MRYLYLIIALLLSLNLSAQYKCKIFDINPPQGEEFFPQNLTAYKGKVYFFGNDSAYGRELMVCDGNTISVAFDSRKGPEDGAPSSNHDKYKHIAVAGEYLYFAALDSISKDSTHLNIYKYDGVNTPSPIYTERLSGTMSNNSIYLNISQMAGLDSLLFFFNRSRNPISGLLIYNPTTNTLKKADTSGSRAYFYSYLIPFKGKLFMQGSPTYVYDPVLDKTKVVASTSSIRFGFHDTLNGKLYYSLHNSTILEYNPVTDTATTIFYGNNIIVPETERNFAVFDNKIYFSARQSLYTDLIKYYDPATGVTSSGQQLINDTNARGFVPYNNKLYYYNYNDFVVQDASGNIKKINNDSFRFFNNTQAVENNGWLYFTAMVKDSGSQNESIRLVAFYDSTTSIKVSNNAVTNITVYPNPTNANALLSMTLKQAATLSVLLTDINGRVIYRGDEQLYSKGKHNITLPMQRLSSGTYIYTMLDNKGQLLNSGRMIKQ